MKRRTKIIIAVSSSVSVIIAGIVTYLLLTIKPINKDLVIYSMDNKTSINFGIYNGKVSDLRWQLVYDYQIELTDKKEYTNFINKEIDNSPYLVKDCNLKRCSTIEDNCCIEKDGYRFLVSKISDKNIVYFRGVTMMIYTFVSSYEVIPFTSFFQPATDTSDLDRKIYDCTYEQINNMYTSPIINDYLSFKNEMKKLNENYVSFNDQNKTIEIKIYDLIRQNISSSHIEICCNDNGFTVQRKTINNMNYVIELKDIKKEYKKKYVLNNLELNVKENTIVSIFGNNGIGKSTLFKILLFLIKYQGNYLLKEGKSICGTTNEPAFFKHLSGVENLNLLLDKYVESYFEKLVELFDMKGYIYNKPFKSYSAGMKQRLANIYVLLSDKDILLFDEPQNALDQNGVDNFFDLITTLRGKKTIILTTHMTYRIDEVSDEIYSIVDGKLKQGYTLNRKNNLKNYSINSNNDEYLNKIYSLAKKIHPEEEIELLPNKIKLILSEEQMSSLIREIYKNTEIKLYIDEIQYGV